MSVKISSIIIAKNEERNISRCIESQLECIDEIVLLVDSNTTDRTAEIARRYENVKVEIETWQGFAKTKEKAVAMASNEWVLWIDADEALSPELCSELKNFKEQEEILQSAFKIPRKAFFLGRWIKHSGWYPGYVVRLFNKNKAKFSNLAVHEGLLVDGEIGKLKGDILHYTDPNIFHYFEKFNNYTSLAAEQLKEQNKKAGLRDILLRPPFLFLKMFIFKRGFLDGLQGFALAVFSSVYVFTKYLKLWELNKGLGENEDRDNT